MKSIFFSLIFLCFSYNVFSQEAQIPVVDTKTDLYFSDVLIYEYQTSEGKKGEFWIYVNSKTGRMLFTKESWNTASGVTDEMTDFIVANPDGSYFQFYQDAEGENESKKVIQDKLEISPMNSKNQNPLIEDQIVEIKKLNKKDFFSTLEATGYSYEYLKMKGGEELYVSKVNFNTHLLYAFSKLDNEAKLPINIDYSNLVTSNYLVVQSNSYSFGIDENSNQIKYQTTFKLVSFEANPYYVPYKDYDYYEKVGEKRVKKAIPIKIK